MITGAQIGQARELLEWAPSRLAQRAKLPITHRGVNAAGDLVLLSA